MALVESGVPADTAAFDLVEAGELRVYVPHDKKFGGGIPKIVRFPRNNGRPDIGASNVGK